MGPSQVPVSGSLRLMDDREYPDRPGPTPGNWPGHGLAGLQPEERGSLGRHSAGAGAGRGSAVTSTMAATPASGVLVSCCWVELTSKGSARRRARVPV